MSKVNGKNIDPIIFKVNLAVGDGSTTNFTLTNTPVASANLFVFVDGIKRTVTVNYTLTDKIVSFVDAPSIGQSIEFNYVKKD